MLFGFGIVVDLIHGFLRNHSVKVCKSVFQVEISVASRSVRLIREWLGFSRKDAINKHGVN